MKQHLLSLFALAGAMFVSTSVVAWDEPVRPTPPAPPTQFQGTFVEPTEGGQYYIYNVGAGLFLGGGQTWGTRGIVLCDSVVSVDQEPVKINNVSNNTTANFVLPIELVAGPTDGQWNFNVLNNSKATGGAGHFVGEDGAQTWIDGDDGRNDNFGAWTIEEYQGGYMIKNVNASEVKYLNEEGEVDRAFGVDGNNTAGTWAGTWTDLYITLPEGNTTRPLLVWQFVSADDFEAVKAYCESFKEKYASDEYQAQMKAYQDALEAYNAKSKLLAAIQEAEEAGVNTDAAGAVYNNPNATLAAVNKAIADLRAKMQGDKYDFTGASEDEPLDVTDQVIENPNFDSNVDGWTIDGQSFWFQARTDGSNDASKNYVQITNFAEAWTASPGTLADGKFSQTAYGLPAGVYMLEVDAMAVKQESADPEGLVEGAFIFVEGVDGDLCDPIPFKAPNYQPKHWSTIFVSDGTPAITFGIKTVSTTANWISCDNFKLTYYGQTQKTQEQILIEKTIAKAGEIEMDLIQCEKVAKDALTEALTAAKEVAKSTDAEAITAANTALEEAIAALETSVADYQTANAFIAKLGETEQNISAQWQELADDFYEWGEELEAKYLAGTLTSEEIAGLEEELATKVRDFIATPGAVKEGDDLTLLIVNADYEILGANNKTVPGWTVVSGSITDHSVAYHNIEGYHTTFDIQQTIKNMPAGAYDVTVQGFVANEGTQNCELYAGSTVTSFKEIHDEYSTYALKADGVDEETGLGTSSGGWPNDRRFELEDGTTVYTPNSMEGAKLYFAEVNPATGEPFYTNHAIIILPEAGDLTIGVRTTGGSEWILWDNFKMTYRGNKAEDYYDEIDRLLNDLALAGEAQDAFLTAQAKTYLTELPAKATTVKQNAVADECIALIGEISEAIKYIAAGNEKGNELGELWEDYDIRKDNISSSDTTYPATLEAANAALSDPASVANNEAIDELIKSIKDGWTGYVLADANEASLENPYDCTDIIYNTNYVHPVDGTASAAGWTYDPNPGLNNEEAEFFNTNFNIYQTINGLRAGYYIFTVEGFYRAGGFVAAATAQRDSTDARNAYMYAVVGNDTVDVYNLHSIFDGAQESPIANNEVTVTLKNEEGEEVEMYIPNNMEDANVYLTYTDEEDLCLYTNYVTIKVDEGGSATIGIRKDINLQDNWTIFTNWKAYYIGTDEPDGVNSISNKARNARKEIFSIDGRQQSTLRRGINIVRMTDGSVQKVLVK